MQEFIPELESDIPIPSSAAEAFPAMTPDEELQLRARTIKFISDLTGDPLIPTLENVEEATELAKEMMSDPTEKPSFAYYPNETIAFLAGMVAQMNVSVVKELSDLKIYIVNKLINEIETTQLAKDRIAALNALGNIDGIDAFKKRTEMTVKVKPIDEVEKELATILEGISYTVSEPEQAVLPYAEREVDGGDAETDA